MDWTHGFCASGKEQSPIDFDNKSIKFDKSKHMYITFNKKTILSLLTNTGLTIKANGDFLDFYVVDFESKLRSYRALSFHIHSHAEHTIN